MVIIDGFLNIFTVWSKVYISDWLLLVIVDHVLIDLIVFKVSVFFNLNFWLFSLWIFLHLFNNSLYVLRDTLGFLSDILEKLDSELATLRGEMLNELNSGLDVLVLDLLNPLSRPDIEVTYEHHIITLEQYHLILELFVLALEFLLVLVNQLDIFQVHNRLLEANFDGTCGVSAVMDYHVHEQLTFVELLLKSCNVHLRIVSYYTQLVQLLSQVVDLLVEEKWVLHWGAGNDLIILCHRGNFIIQRSYCYCWDDLQWFRPLNDDRSLI